MKARKDGGTGVHIHATCGAGVHIHATCGAGVHIHATWKTTTTHNYKYESYQACKTVFSGGTWTRLMLRLKREAKTSSESFDVTQ